MIESFFHIKEKQVDNAALQRCYEDNAHFTSMNIANYETSSALPLHLFYTADIYGFLLQFLFICIDTIVSIVTASITSIISLWLQLSQCN